ncbi:MAG: hypothetical protein HY706_14490 [Candidatus Hydrogenedentes bacterium]|nr:hypothetical protein [Candidatus Hydrogenedentota bacterium]
MSIVHHASTPPADSSPVNSFTALVVRVAWIFGSGAVLPLLAIFILMNEEGAFSIVDVIYAGLVPLLIAARYLDIMKFHGMTIYGEPANLTHAHRFALSLLGGGTLGWIVVHGIAYMMMQ